MDMDFFMSDTISDSEQTIRSVDDFRICRVDLIIVTHKHKI